MKDRKDKPPGPGDPSRTGRPVLGNSWINPKGEIYIYYAGRELKPADWEILNRML